MVRQKIQHRGHILGILEPEQLVKSKGGATSLTGLIYSEDPVKVSEWNYSEILQVWSQ